MTADVAVLKKKMADVIDRHGEWTAHAIEVAEGVSTIEPSTIDRRLGRISQLMADLSHKPLNESRILDLACAEGHYAIECALLGAEVVAIEGREANLAKVQFVEEARGLDRLSLFQDDVRNLSREKYGMFDIVICSGILYHLDAPDVFQFAGRVAEVCKHLTIVDTQISIKDKVRFDYEGHTYWGCYYQEHQPDASMTDRLRDLWASIDNNKSVWLTRFSIYNLLRDIGYTSVLECHNPSMVDLARDRITLAATKGQRAAILSSPLTNSTEPERWPEQLSQYVNAIQDPKAQRIRFAKSLIPRSLRGHLRNLRIRLHKNRGANPPGPWEWTDPWRRR